MLFCGGTLVRNAWQARAGCLCMRHVTVNIQVVLVRQLTGTGTATANTPHVRMRLLSIFWGHFWGFIHLPTCSVLPMHAYIHIHCMTHGCHVCVCAAALGQADSAQWCPALS